MKKLLLKIKFFILIIPLVLTIPSFTQDKEILWSEDFEGDWTENWSVDEGTWEIGIQTSGPDSAYIGENCAATILNGNYPVYADTRLVSFTAFSVPVASESSRVRFWHWYSFSTSDLGKVQKKVDGTTDWVDISPSHIYISSYALYK